MVDKPVKPDDAPQAKPSDVEETKSAKAEEKNQQADASPNGDKSVKELTAERDHYLEMARRSRADFENFQKRAARDLANERLYAPQSFMADLLPVLDNLNRAIESAQSDDSSVSGLLEGIQIVRKQWMDVFSKHGVSPIATDGEPFDPNLHEAIMQQPNASVPPMTVLFTTRSGFKLHERVLRPAQVIVSSAMPEEQNDTSAGDEAEKQQAEENKS